MGLMFTRRLLLASLVSLSSLAALLALSADVAQAEPPRLVSYGNFGSGTPLAMGVAVDNSCYLNALSGSACTTADPSNEDVYVAGVIELASFGQSHINKFDASGKLLPPSPFGEGYHSGAAVNPTNGDVYVFNLSGEIDTYDPSSGVLLSSFSVPFGGFEALVQIATDSAGNVYVPNTPNNEVLEYEATPQTSAPPNNLLKTFTDEGKLKGPTGVAVGPSVAPSGNVWVADKGDNRIVELNKKDEQVTEIKSKGVQSVALDTHGDVFAIVENSADFCGSLAPPCIHLVEYSSAGAQLADIGAGSFGVVGEKAPSMLAVNDSSGRVYVTDGLKNLVWIFGAPTAPVVVKELGAEVSTSEAKLGALINPGGIETSYRIEYDTREYVEGEAPHGVSVPSPEGSVGQGVTPRTVWASASSLAPSTTYHYRVVATNELGTVVGTDQTFTTETAAEGSCPNEQLRGGFSARLPDCRAYELVTPPTKTSTQPDTNFFRLPGTAVFSGNHAAREGNRMSFKATEVMPGSQSGGFSYVATRGASGWSSENVLPLQSYTGDRCPEHDARMQAYSADLSKGVLFDGGGENLSEYNGGCGAEGVEVVSGEPLGVENLLLRDNINGAYQLINVPPPGVIPADAHFQGASSDLSHVVFDEHAQLTAGAPGGVDDLYDWSGGVVRLVTVLPDGIPAVGSLAAGWEDHPNVISADGSHIFFTAGGDLYVRLNAEQPPSEECATPASACTVQVDASKVGGSGGGGKFMDASVDGSQVFFLDANRLTADATAASGKPDLYEYEVNAEPGKPGTLTDVTVDSGEPANVQGVSGTSEDGSLVYFVASGLLSGSETNEHGETAQSGQPNLYLYHGGTTTFIATLSGGGIDACVTETCVRVPPNGLFFAFESHKSLTGYDNTDTVLKEPDPEIYLYDVASNQLACASCNPSGEAPAAGGATMEASGDGAPHYLSGGGRLFFGTAEALLPRDTNGQTDVYEYESNQLHLISAGTSSSESLIVDASESGNDVFFLTRQKLVPQDTNEEALNIYDARVDGGFPETAVPPACTTADACRSAPEPQPSIFGSPSSATFSGAGNITPSKAKPKVKRKSKPAKCKKGFVKKKGKCAKKPKRKARKSAHAGRKGK
jgi:hypothetical protein